MCDSIETVSNNQELNTRKRSQRQDLSDDESYTPSLDSGSPARAARHGCEELEDILCVKRSGKTKIQGSLAEVHHIYMKTPKEVAFLEKMFAKDPTWSRKTVQACKKALGLKTDQVYKWGYDKKQLMKKLNKKQPKRNAKTSTVTQSTKVVKDVTKSNDLTQCVSALVGNLELELSRPSLNSISNALNKGLSNTLIVEPLTKNLSGASAKNTLLEEHHPVQNTIGHTEEAFSESPCVSEDALCTPIASDLNIFDSNLNYLPLCENYLFPQQEKSDLGVLNYLEDGIDLGRMDCDIFHESPIEPEHYFSNSEENYLF